jgi:RNA polymerase sigma factor (sigma-70 family)
MPAIPTTRWSLIRQVRDGPDAGRALAQLCAAYRPVVLRHLRRLGNGHDAEDATQAFFVRFLERRLPAQADAARGSFRAYLFAAVRNHQRELERTARAQRHAPAGFVDAAILDATEGGEPRPDAVFDHDWACHVLALAHARLAAEADRAGKGELFAQLRSGLAEGPGALDLGAIGLRLGLPANTVAVALKRLRERLRALVRRELADTLAPGADLAAEMGWFKRALRGD